MKKLWALLTLLVSFSAYADGLSLNFTSSGLTGWSLSAGGTQSTTGYSSNGVGASIVTSISNFHDGQYIWNINPYTGQYMASLQPSYSSASYSTMTSTLGLSATSVTSIQNFLNAHSGGGMTNPTNASWMYYPGLSLTAGQTFSIAWNFVATDYTPWNDTSITSLVATSGGGLATINNVLGQYSVLGAINPGAGNYSTGSYGSTGWELAQYTVNTTGIYTLGFGSFNLGDTVNSPILLVSGNQGTTFNGTTPVAPVAPNPGSSAPTTPSAPPSPTLVSTTTTNQVQNLIVGNQSETITTPVTTKTYSDGTSTTTNGTATTVINSSAAFTGVHFGAAQVADTQWNVQACTQTNTCQIYSTAPGKTYNTGSAVTIGATQYITFVPNTGSDKATLPWTMLLVNSDGTYTSLGNSKILLEGVQNGQIYMFVDNGNLNGTLLSANLGLSGQGMTFTGIQNPSVAQTNSDASLMSANPLSAGQTGGTGAGVSGLTYTTYLAGGPSPTIPGTQDTTGVVSTVNFTWTNGILDTGHQTGIEVHFTGYFRANYTGQFQFGVTTDDGAILKINNSTLVNSWVEQGPTFHSGSINLTNGQIVPIDLWYYQNGGGATINLYWLNPATGQWEIIPASMLGTTSDVFQYLAPVVVSTSTSNQVSSSSSVGSTNTITNSYTLDGKTYTVVGTSTPTTVTTTTTPVTTTTWSDGSTTTSNGTSTTTQNTTWSYTVTGPANPPVSPYVNNNNNGVYIDQVNAGSTDKVSANQSGHGNYQNITLGGSNNTINTGQGYTLNSLGIATESLTPSNFNVLGLGMSGNYNTTNISQVGSSNSVIQNITGNTNSSTITQTGSYNQAYNLLQGNSNTSTIIQSGNSNLASVNLYGDNNNASISQTGNNHGAVVNLINAGGPNTATVIQTGNGDAYAVQQTCTVPAGCGLTVIRNK